MEYRSFRVERRGRGKKPGECTAITVNRLALNLIFAVSTDFRKSRLLRTCHHDYLANALHFFALLRKSS